MKRILSCLMAAAAVGGASAATEVADEPGQDAVWSNSGTRGSQVALDYFTDANWEGGTAPDFTKPSATNLTVKLTATPTEAKRLQEIADNVQQRYYGFMTLKHEFTDASNTGTYFHSLEGGPWTRFDLWWTAERYVMAITDPSTYLGWFDIQDRERGALSTLYLQASPSYTPVVNRLCAMGAPNVKVPTGARGLVKEAFGPGQLNVNIQSVGGTKSVMPDVSAGTVEVLNQPGPLTDLRVWNGTAVLHGVPDDTPNALAGVPVLHLDASRADTFTTTTVDGTIYVEEWRDADGRALKVIKNADSSRPRLDVDAETSGTVVNFGQWVNGATVKHAELGSSGILQLSSKITTAREIHVVFRDQFRDSPMPLLVGNWLSEWSRDWLRQDWHRLFSINGFCDTPTLAGHTLFNGQSTLASAMPDTTRRLNVISSSVNDHDATIQFVGGANPGTWQGGAVIAELLVYTNELTVAERQQTHRYLMRKWHPGEKIFDYGVVNLAATGAAVEVADGTLAVRELILPAGTKTFVKKGAGTLELARISPVDAKIRVEAGNVSFASDLVATADPQLAADPTLHFDASRAETDIETYLDDAGKTRVSVWHDVRGQGWQNANGDVYTLKTGTGTYVYTNATVETSVSPTGLSMVDLGPYIVEENKQIKNEATCLAFYRNGTKEANSSANSSATDQRHREGFLVYKKTDDKANPLGSYSWTVTKMANNAGNMFLHRMYSFNRLVAGYWTYDGNWIDPHSAPNTKDEVHVVAFRGTRPLAVNAFGIDRGSGQTGGLKIGEVVYYDRSLTAQERRDTELYLLKKWKGVTSHPQDSLVVARKMDVVYPADATATVGVAADQTIPATLRSIQSLVKTGAGTLDASVNSTTLKALSVEEGTLRIVTGDMFIGAAFHADATDLSSMKYTIDAVGNTNVTTWGGATAVTLFKSATPGLPKLVSHDVNGMGHVMPFVDMGDQAQTTGAVARISLAASMNWPDVGPLQEFHIVLKDKSTQNPWNELIGWTREDISANARYPFLRQENDHILYAEWASQAFWNGYIGVDGLKAKPTDHFDNNVHLVTFVADSPVTNNTFAFAQRGGYRIGGQLIGECVAFSGTNTVEQRTVIENHLRRKWLNESIPGSAADLWNLDLVSVAHDATVAFVEAGMVKAAALGGRGTVSFASTGGLTGVSDLAFTYRDKTDFDAIQVQGTFDVAASGRATVTVDLAEDADLAAQVGEHTVLSATTFTGFDNFGNWTLTAMGVPSGAARPFLRAKAGKGLVLEFVPSGTVILFR